jgi:hypothetical protein
MRLTTLTVAVTLLLACHHNPPPATVVIPAGSFLFTNPEPLCREVTRPGDRFTAPIVRVKALTGAIDPEIPRGTLALFEIDGFESDGGNPVVHLRVKEIVIAGRRVPVTAGLASSDPESASAPPGAPVCVPAGTRFLGQLNEDVTAK